MPIYKVSCVIVDSDKPGAILNLNEAPEPGKTIQVAGHEYTVIDALELTPPRGDFHFLHVNLRIKENSN